MSLFPCEIVDDGSRTPLIETPAGVLHTRIVAGPLDTGTTPATLTGTTSRGQRLSRWTCSHADAELLVHEITPSLPPEMRVDGCVAAVWRVRAHVDIVAFLAECQFDPIAEPDGGPTSGEGLDAQTWRVGPDVISVGTEDGEMLSIRAERNALMPSRLQHDLGLTTVISTSRGLRIPFSSLRASETLQVHFVVSWVRTEDDERSATWFAVDQPWHRILEGTGCDERAA